MMLGQMVASIGGGFLTQKIGYYMPLGILSSRMMAIGSGLITIFELSINAGTWIGYQVLCALDTGFCFQMPNLVTKWELRKRGVPIRIALSFFGQLLGVSVFVSVDDNELSNQLIRRLSGIPVFSKKLVVSGGTTVLINTVPRQVRGKVTAAYNALLHKVFLVALILACLTILGTASIEWRSLLKNPGLLVDHKSLEHLNRKEQRKKRVKMPFRCD